MMKDAYRINEMFYSLQGEGRWTGRAAVFVRFGGCNLRCPFCDTDFSKTTTMTADEVTKRVVELAGDCRFVVVTGGEPSLQLDDRLVEHLHAKGFYIAVETNGTHILPDGVDWVTLSPKNLFVDGADIAIGHADEVKLVFDGQHDVPDYSMLTPKCLFLQPCDTGNDEENRKITTLCIDYIKANPQWQLSLQTHKIVGIR